MVFDCLPCETSNDIFGSEVTKLERGQIFSFISVMTYSKKRNRRHKQISSIKKNFLCIKKKDLFLNCSVHRPVPCGEFTVR